MVDSVYYGVQFTHACPWCQTEVAADYFGGYTEKEATLEHDQTATTGTTISLGARLREVRELKKLSISFVAEKAGISTAYLQKLEVGHVQQPSPRVLHALAGVLEIAYAELMRLAGYIVPGDASSRRRRNELTHAASSERLTEEEAQALAEYLNWYRSRRRATK